MWRDAHFNSHTASRRKGAVLTACLKKVHFMASDNETLKDSAMQKLHDQLHELFRLHYPRKLLWSACTTIWECRPATPLSLMSGVYDALPLT